MSGWESNRDFEVRPVNFYGNSCSFTAPSLSAPTPSNGRKMTQGFADTMILYHTGDETHPASYSITLQYLTT